MKERKKMSRSIKRILAFSLIWTAFSADHINAEGQEDITEELEELQEDYEKISSYNSTVDNNTSLKWTSEDGILTITGQGSINEWNDLYKKNEVHIVRLSEGIDGIGEGVFANSLCKKVELPSTIKSIGNGAFTWSSLMAVDIPDSVELLDEWAFEHCEELRYITIGNGVKEIGAHCLRQCENLEQIVLPESLQSLGRWVFSRDYNLKTVVFTGSKPSFGEEVFYDVSADIYYPKNDMTWSDIVGDNCGGILNWIPYSDLSEIKLKEGLSSDFIIDHELVHGYLGTDADVVIPEGVKGIYKNAFANCGTIKSITFPTTLETIGESAFMKCKGIQKLEFPSSLIGIGEDVFLQCTGMETVIFHSERLALGHNVFNQCPKLKTIDLNGADVSSNNAVTQCNNLKYPVFNEYGLPIYHYNITCLNRYSPVFNDSNAPAVLYIQTDNPIAGNFELEGTPQSLYGNIYVGGFEDIKVIDDGLYTSDGIYKVDGGFVTLVNPPKAGIVTISVYERDEYRNIPTNASVTIDFHDYEKEYDLWLDQVINEYTSTEMTPKEKIETIVNTAFKDWKYPEVKAISGELEPIFVLANLGAFWQRKRMHSLTAPEVLVRIGEKVGYNLETYDEWEYHAYVHDQEGTMYTVCPFSETGIVDPIEYVDFANYKKPWNTEQEDQVNAFVTRLYQLCFNREPDKGGFRMWTKSLLSKKYTAAYVVQAFFTSNEMKNMKLPNEEWVERCYLVMMNRASDAGGKKGWVNKLDIGMSQTYVLRGFVGSTEFNNICKDYGVERGSVTISEPRDQNQGITEFVGRCYSEVLGRKAEVGGLNDWCKRILT
ncbi:MAG: leucine-rich repeat protein, partial [Lachnospiraceae bacterium]|nr:leucine-rich repeat protein [Lachnospiraceae bacterium]